MDSWQTLVLSTVHEFQILNSRCVLFSPHTIRNFGFWNRGWKCGLYSDTCGNFWKKISVFQRRASSKVTVALTREPYEMPNSDRIHIWVSKSTRSVKTQNFFLAAELHIRPLKGGVEWGGGGNFLTPLYYTSDRCRMYRNALLWKPFFAIFKQFRHHERFC